MLLTGIQLSILGKDPGMDKESKEAKAESKKRHCNPGFQATLSARQDDVHFASGLPRYAKEFCRRYSRTKPGGFGLRKPAAAFVLAACCGTLVWGTIIDSCIVTSSASRLAEESGSRLPQSMVLRTDHQ